MNIFRSEVLKERTYLVTGASSGIGRATAKALSDCGARLILGGRDKSRLNDTMSFLSGQNHLIAQGSIGTADETYEWMRELSISNGAFNGVFHCAGMELILPMRMTRQAQLDNVLSSNLHSAFGIARAASIKGVMVDGGSVLFMSSVAATRGQAGLTAYSASKAAIEAMVRSLSCELASRMIRVNAIAAGAVRTPMHDRLLKVTTEEAAKAYERAHLLGFGTPEDVANGAVYLLGPSSSWVTGTILTIDGGFGVR